MFEQITRADVGSQRKPWSFALSLTVQTGLVASLLAVPLLRVARMNAVVPTLVFVPHQLQQAAPLAAQSSTARTASPLQNHNIFRAPTTIPRTIGTGPDVPNAPEFAVGAPPGDTGAALTDVLGEALGPRLSPAPPPPPDPPRTAPSAPTFVRIGGNVQAASLISNPRPTYPPLAKQARISGVVHLSAYIGTDGHIRSLKVLSGHPMLVSAALSAVAGWVYRPTLLNGRPVDVVTEIEVRFTLN